MIPAINPYNTHSQINAFPQNRAELSFGAKRILLYNGYYEGGNKFVTGLKNLWVSVKNFFGNLNQISSETPKEISENNKFIAKIQRQLSGRRLPFGEFNTNAGDLLIIEKDKMGNTKLEIRSKDTGEFIRSALVDNENTILKYKTFYPWRIFIKTDNGYRSMPNVDEYIKEIASDPMTSFELIPRP